MRRQRVCSSSTRNKIVFKSLHTFENGAGRRPVWQPSSCPETVELKYTCTRFVLMETKIAFNLLIALHHAMDDVILEIVFESVVITTAIVRRQVYYLHTL
jgi:hypothetical protein